MSPAKKILLLFLVIVLLGAAGFVGWAVTPLGPLPAAQAALQSGSSVTVSGADWLVFEPTGAQPLTGLVLYPGGRINPGSYAPLAREIAAQGYLVVITPMPLNLAVTSPNLAAEVIAAYPQIRHWAVGGHSLGGTMAARFARQNPGQVQGLVLWAAYPAAQDDLSGQKLQVVSISASNDGLATPDKVEASRPLLPAGAGWVVIEGGNHAQFGSYGDQPGDAQAAISREEQQHQIAAATVSLLAQLGN